jgi:hypothetical protein
MFITDPGKLARFHTKARLWQGIPGIERTQNGRLFASLYSGSTGEGNGNYSVVFLSNDGGQTWTEPVAVAYIGEEGRCYDPGLWIDPLGRLWFYWNTYPDYVVWAAICEDPDAEALTWLPPRKIGKEVMMNKPTVVSEDCWLFPVAVWGQSVFAGNMMPSSEIERLAFVYRSSDQGETFEKLGGVSVPERAFDEHMVVSLPNNVLWLLVRTRYGIGQSFSYDGGNTWTPGEDTGFGGPDARFFIRRLSSGRLLLINHYKFTGRNNLTAMLSEDNGKTWLGFLLLDGRDQVSYPDAVEGNDGFIYAIYDRGRHTDKEILMAKFTEEDILAGTLIHPESRLRWVINKVESEENF